MGRMPSSLVDCLTVWLSNLMYHGRDVAGEVERLVRALPAAKGMSSSCRMKSASASCPTMRWRGASATKPDAPIRRSPRVADEVVFMAAGLPLMLKKAKASGHGEHGQQRQSAAVKPEARADVVRIELERPSPMVARSTCRPS